MNDCWQPLSSALPDLISTVNGYALGICIRSCSAPMARGRSAQSHQLPRQTVRCEAAPNRLEPQNRDLSSYTRRNRILTRTPTQVLPGRIWLNASWACGITLGRQRRDAARPLLRKVPGRKVADRVSPRPPYQPSVNIVIGDRSFSCAVFHLIAENGSKGTKSMWGQLGCRSKR